MRRREPRLEVLWQGHAPQTGDEVAKHSYLASLMTEAMRVLSGLGCETLADGDLVVTISRRPR